jgi:prepilin-type N-terminal cleavage/methylation domain-containing protein
MRRTAGGFTLIEVAIAITMLGVLMLGTLSANGRLVESVARERLRTQAAEAADAQIALVRLWPSYGSLDSAFAGTAANVPSPDGAGLRRSPASAGRARPTTSSG